MSQELNRDASAGATAAPVVLWGLTWMYTALDSGPEFAAASPLPSEDEDGAKRFASTEHEGLVWFHAFTSWERATAAFTEAVKLTATSGEDECMEAAVLADRECRIAARAWRTWLLSRLPHREADQ